MNRSELQPDGLKRESRSVGHAIPNLLSASRFLIAPLVVSHVLRGSHLAALAWLAVAGISDVLDGVLARRYGWGSRIGALLDPVADKVLLVTGYLSLAWARLVPPWLAALVVGRDVAILSVALALMLAGKRRRFPPSVWGKASTVCQVVTGVATLGASALGNPVRPLLGALFWITALATAWSGLHYAWSVARTPSAG